MTCLLRPTRFLPLLLVLLRVILLCCPALAEPSDGQDPCGPQVRDARLLAEAGLRIYKSAARQPDPRQRVREYEQALRCFLAAQAESREGAAKLYHPLGLVYEKLERDVEAVEAFRRFLAEVPERQRIPGVTKQIDDKLQVLLRQVAQLSIDTVPGLDVRIDEKFVGKAPLRELVVVTPGTHVITVGDPQVGTLGAEVVARAGQVHRVDLSGWKPRQAETPGQAQAQVESPGPQPPAEAVAFLSVRSNRIGATVQVDGRLRGRTPLVNLALPPGVHEIVARSGRQSLSSTVTLSAEERRTVTLDFPVQPWVWALVGVGAAAAAGTAVGLGVYFGTSVGRPDAVVGF